MRKDNSTTSKRCRFDIECRQPFAFRTTFESKSTCETTNSQHPCQIDIVSISFFRTGILSLDPQTVAAQERLRGKSESEVRFPSGRIHVVGAAHSNTFILRLLGTIRWSSGHNLRADTPNNIPVRISRPHMPSSVLKLKNTVSGVRVGRLHIIEVSQSKEVGNRRKYRCKM